MLLICRKNYHPFFACSLASQHELSHVAHHRPQGVQQLGLDARLEQHQVHVDLRENVENVSYRTGGLRRMRLVPSPSGAAP